MLHSTQSDKEITQASYQATANEFTRNVAELAPMQSIERFLKLLPAQPSILDLGCGSGRDAKLFSEQGAKVLGIDYCSALLEIAQEHAPQAEFKLMDIEELDLSPVSFDGVWAACSLGHIAKSNFPKVLQTIYQLLNSKGAFYLTLKKGEGEGVVHDQRYEGDIHKFWSYFEEQELQEYLQQANFSILDLETVETKHSYLTRPALRVFCQRNA